MQKHYKIYVIFTAILFLNACSTISPRLPFNKQNRNSIHSTRVMLNSTQREIVMEHNNWFDSEVPDPYAPMDSGPIVHHNIGLQPQDLIGTLIDVSVKNYHANYALSSMAPLRNNLEDYDFLNSFSLKFQKNVTKLPWVKVQKFELKYNLEGTEPEIVNNQKESSILFIGITYSLNSNFKRLKVIAYVKFVQKAIGKDEPRTLYANNFAFIYRLTYPKTKNNYYQKYWVMNNSAMLKTKLGDAATLLSDVIVMDMDDSTVETYSPNKKIVKFFDLDGGRTKGNLIKKKNDYFIIVEKSKQIYIVNAEDIIL